MDISVSHLPQNIADALAPQKAIESNGSFIDTLGGAIEQVDRLQADADAQMTGLLQGNNHDVHSTMIAVEKADIAFQMMMQVRNKIVNAYQEISRMQF